MGSSLRIASCILALAFAASARAQDQASPVSFPETMDRPALLDWLKRETDISPKQVVAVGPSAITALMQVRRISDEPRFRMTMRAEAIDPTVREREGYLSWYMVLDVDCPAHKVRQGATTGYHARNLLEAGQEVRPDDSVWREPTPGAALDSVWRAVCEPNFRWPLVDSSDLVAAQRVSLPRTPPPPRTPSPPKAKPLTLRTFIETPGGADFSAAAPQPRPAAAVAGKGAVQIAASTSPAGARLALAGIKGKVAAWRSPLSGHVETAVVKGATFYRVVIAGFDGARDGEAFCGTLRASGQACFVRR